MGDDDLEEEETEWKFLILKQNKYLSW
jgi:hypothetical protein